MPSVVTRLAGVSQQLSRWPLPVADDGETTMKQVNPTRIYKIAVMY